MSCRILKIVINNTVIKQRLYEKVETYLVPFNTRIVILAIPDSLPGNRQAALSMGFSRQEYWSRLPFSSPEDLPNPGTERMSPTLQTDSSLSEAPGKPIITEYWYQCFTT